MIRDNLEVELEQISSEENEIENHLKLMSSAKERYSAQQLMILLDSVFQSVTHYTSESTTNLTQFKYYVCKNIIITQPLSSNKSGINSTYMNDYLQNVRKSILPEIVKNNGTLIVPLELHELNHWVVLHIDLKNFEATIIDSFPAFIKYIPRNFISYSNVQEKLRNVFTDFLIHAAGKVIKHQGMDSTSNVAEEQLNLIRKIRDMSFNYKFLGIQDDKSHCGHAALYSIQILAQHTPQYLEYLLKIKRNIKFTDVINYNEALIKYIKNIRSNLTTFMPRVPGLANIEEHWVTVSPPESPKLNETINSEDNKLKIDIVEITEELKQQWIEKAHQTFKQCFKSNATMIEALITRASVYVEGNALSFEKQNTYDYHKIIDSLSKYNYDFDTDNLTYTGDLDEAYCTLQDRNRIIQPLLEAGVNLSYLKSLPFVEIILLEAALYHASSGEFVEVYFSQFPYIQNPDNQMALMEDSKQFQDRLAKSFKDLIIEQTKTLKQNKIITMKNTNELALEEKCNQEDEMIIDVSLDWIEVNQSESSQSDVASQPESVIDADLLSVQEALESSDDEVGVAEEKESERIQNLTPATLAQNSLFRSNSSSSLTSSVVFRQRNNSVDGITKVELHNFISFLKEKFSNTTSIGVKTIFKKLDSEEFKNQVLENQIDSIKNIFKKTAEQRLSGYSGVVRSFWARRDFWGLGKKRSAEAEILYQHCSTWDKINKNSLKSLMEDLKNISNPVNDTNSEVSNVVTAREINLECTL